MAQSTVLLINPKSPHNVGGVLRACSIFGLNRLLWTGQRVMDKADIARHTGTTFSKKKWRLPREERLKEYEVDWARHTEPLDLDDWIAQGLTPVAVEKRDGSELLPDFIHPENALYIFGPEDSGVPKNVLAQCHRFLRIPSATPSPLNLAASVNVVLYDRMVKA